MRSAATFTVLVLLLLTLAGCGNKDAAPGDGEPGAGPTEPTTASASTTPGPTPTPNDPADDREPFIAGAASSYAPSLDELPGDYRVNDGETYGLDSGGFITFGPFHTIDEGQLFVDTHQYINGYTVLYEPDGLLAGVLEGRYFITIWVHIFASFEDAAAAYELFDTQSKAQEGAEIVPILPLANQSGASGVISGTVGDSPTAAEYHRVVFRRGNLIAVVQTFGSAPLINVNPARFVAGIIDERAVGEREAEAPTPAPTSSATGF